jgi:DNA polymerase III epsilon subunit-like protein
MQLRQLIIDAVTATGQWQWSLGDLDPAQPTMVRIAALLVNDDEVIDRCCRIVTPLPGRPYPSPAATLQHGIDHTTIAGEGVVLGAVLARMAMLITRAELIIGHNVDFHIRVLRHAFAEGGLTMPEVPRLFCTMRRSIAIVDARGDNGKRKLPRLAEAYAFFAKEGLVLPADPILRGSAMVDAVRTVYRGIIAHQAPLFAAPANDPSPQPAA